MPVLPPGNASLRARTAVLTVLALLAALACVVAAATYSAQAASANKSLSKRTKITAPKSSVALHGTLKGYRQCGARFPGRTKSRRVYVTGPITSKKKTSKKRTSKTAKRLATKSSSKKKGSSKKKSKKKTKTKRLKVRSAAKGGRKLSCVWNTKKVKDGKYKLTFSARVRYRHRWRKVRVTRTVKVDNRTFGNRPAAANGDAPQLGVGNARYVGRLETQWDPWLTQANQSPTLQSWVRKHMWGVVAHTSFFDGMTSWSPPALVYKDLYAIYKDDTATLSQHPEWVLKDAAGTWMSIPWGCNPGPCPQFAGDIGNPAFRSAWIAQARKTLASGYVGLWIDDANMEMRVGGPDGVERPPIDPRTGQEMTFTDWRRYIAEFLEQIRRELPQAQLVANVLWFGGTAIGRDSDAYIQRAYTAVDRLNLERGFNDDGLTFGSSPKDIWSVDQFMRFIDRMHARGIPVTLDSAGIGAAAWEYNLAGFFLVDQGADAVGEMRLAPGQWWNGWDVRLGAPRGDRSRRSDGVYTRSFANGLVYLNPPRGSTKFIKLPRKMKRIDGRVVSSLQLPSGAGAVLLPAS